MVKLPETTISQEIQRIGEGIIPLDFNWNRDSHPESKLPDIIPPEPTAEQISKVRIIDEGLRDGLHGVSRYPDTGEMLEYVDIASQVGVDVMTVGIFTEEGVVDRRLKILLAEMRDQYPHISPVVLSLATEESIEWAADCAQINPKLQTIVFMGSAPSRMIVENWTRDFVLNQLTWAVDKAVREHGLFVIGATEHTTQTPPDFLKDIIRVGVENGAKVFCVADTIGTARPVGSFRIIEFVKTVLDDMGSNDVLIDWHGHSDIGLSIPNALTAVATGANRVHLVPWGVGERAGNTPLEVFLINASQILRESELKEPWELVNLSKLLEVYARITDNPIPTYGAMGTRAYITSLGLHTAAMLKAEKLAQEAIEGGQRETGDRLTRMGRTIYTGNDPAIVGREHEIRISHLSGDSTVRLWAIKNGVSELTADQIEIVLQLARRFGRELSHEEIMSLLNRNNGL